MASATARAPKPCKRKARSVLADVRASITNLNINDESADTTKLIQVQHLGARLGLSPHFASIVASLHFGEVAHV